MIQHEDLKRANEIFFDEFKQKVAQVIDSGWYVLGQEVKAFETEFANYCGANHCVGLASGLDALILALDLMDYPPQSEIIVPANTYVATILSILRCGHIPVLVEPSLDTYNIDPQLIEASITPKTRAIMPVHLYGKPCDMDVIMAIAKARNLDVIEDCAQSHGARFNGQMVGTFGIGAFSFYPTKNLGALGDAGALLVPTNELDEKVRKLRNYGSSVRYYNDLIGYNSRLDEIQAGFLRIKLRSLDAITEKKQKFAALYLKYLSDKFVKPVQIEGVEDVHHLFPIRHPKRDQLKAYLLENDIRVEVHYPVPPYRQTALSHIFTNAHFPISDEIHDTILSLPLSFGHTESEIERVIDVLNKFKD